jgi:cytochrome c peroxidase
MTATSHHGLAAGVGLALLCAAAAACSSSAPPPDECDLAAGLSASQCTMVKAMVLPADLPPSPANDHADDVDAAHLGFLVFFDARFSSNQNVRCETCHAPEDYFDDEKTTSVGLSTGVRNSPTLFNAARLTHSFFWDGRADSLWSQPLFAMENPLEMGFTRLGVAHRLVESFSAEYAAAFSALPDLSDATRFPAAGMPGQPAWDQMAPVDQVTINDIVANLGKAMEAYDRKLAAGPAPFDAFLGGQSDALTDAQKSGLASFVQLGCATCHSGPMFTDEGFHNLGVPALPGAAPDRGRIDGIPILLANPFDLDGPYVDGSPQPLTITSSPSDLGAFRTPSLRNVGLSAPYGHNGTFATLPDVINFHLQGGGRGKTGFVGDVDPALLPQSASTQTVQNIADFLSTLTGATPPPPWNDWPSKS